MNLSKRPKLHPPRALLSRQPGRPTPSLALVGPAATDFPPLPPHELRRLIAGMIG